jgi:hypothetical protein
MEQENNLQKNIGIFLGVIVILGVLFVTIFLGKKSTDIPVADQTQSVVPITTPAPVNAPISPITAPKNNPASVSKTTQTSPITKTTPEYTLTQVATHSNSSSCWSIVNTSVYNLTLWINSHPGGSRAILGMCGKDATTAFLNQHGGQKRPEQELATFFIGNYKK